MKWDFKVLLLSVTFPVILTLSGCRSNINEFSTISQEFEDSVKKESVMCFYTSTLEMLNLEHDTTLTSLISGIKKIKIVTFRFKDDSTYHFNPTTWTEKIRQQKYIDLMNIHRNNQNISVFMLQNKNKKPAKFFGIVSDTAQVVFVDLVGNVQLKYIMSAINGNLNLTGFTSVLNSSKSNNKKKRK